MDISQIRDMLSQAQAGARVTTAIGEPVPVGDRIVIPVAEVAYGGGGGGGAGKAAQEEQGEGFGVGSGVRVRPLGCWVIDQDGEAWLPALDMNRIIMMGGALIGLALLTIRAIVRR